MMILRSWLIVFKPRISLTGYFIRTADLSEQFISLSPDESVAGELGLFDVPAEYLLAIESSNDRPIPAGDFN